MTYASANRRPNPAALVGALGIPGAFGALLVVGLAVTVVTAPPVPRLKGETVTDVPLPPPPPPTPDKPQPDSKATNTPQTPTAPSSPTLTLPPIELGTGPTIDALPGLGETGTGPIELTIPQPGPSASPYAAVGAKPKGNVSRWVTNSDYRSRWIMEELEGTARFSLQIDASGKVSSCTITRSTGHPALDAATCDLVTKRARFDAARDTSGKPVAGTYSSAVTWRIPE